MRYLVLTVVMAGLAFSQARSGPYWSLGGFGNVVYPGTGHAPNTASPTHFAPGAGHGAIGGTPLPANHRQHSRTVVVPYPVYYGGYSYGDPSVGYGAGYSDQQAPPIINTNTAPSVVINQGYVPPQANPQVRDYGDAPDPQQAGMRVYQNSSHPYDDPAANQPGPSMRTRTVNSDQPTIYLIAFRDHSIVQALGYWMEGPTLHYVSVEHSLNQASMDLIDRDLSQRLNDERGVEFKIPPAR